MKNEVGNVVSKQMLNMLVKAKGVSTSKTKVGGGLPESFGDIRSG